LNLGALLSLRTAGEVRCVPGLPSLLASRDRGGRKGAGALLPSAIQDAHMLVWEQPSAQEGWGSKGEEGYKL